MIGRVWSIGAMVFAAIYVEAAAPEPGACPVTVVNNGQGGRFENDALRVGLWPNGKVIFRQEGAGFIGADGSLGMKFWWWRLRPGRLEIEGRRLDGTAPPLRADIPEGYGVQGFQAVGMIFPTEGCWEVTGRVGGRSLTFVTMVVRVIDEATAPTKSVEAL